MKGTKRWLVTILLVIAALMVYRFASILSLFAAAAIIAFLLTPLVNLAESRLKLPRGLCVLLVLAFVLVVFLFIIFGIVPILVQQISSLTAEFPRHARDIESFLGRIIETLQQYGVPQKMVDGANEILDQSGDILFDLVMSVLTAALQYSLRILDGIICMVLAVYFLLDGKKMVDSLLRQLPEGVSHKLQGFIASSEKIVWDYLRVKVIISGIVALVAVIGFTVMGSKYAVLFGVMTFLLDFVPYFGSIIAGVVQVVIVFATLGLNMAVVAGIFVLVVQQIQGNLIEPKIQGHTIGIHPVAVLFAVFACNSLWGPLGMLVSVPVAGFSKIILKELFSYLLSGEEKEEAPAKETG